MQENTDQNNSEYGHFLPSERLDKLDKLNPKKYWIIIFPTRQPYTIHLNSTKVDVDDFSATNWLRFTDVLVKFFEDATERGIGGDQMQHVIWWLKRFTLTHLNVQ